MYQGEICRNTLDECLTALPMGPEANETESQAVLSEVKEILCTAITTAIYYPHLLDQADFTKEE